MFKFLIDIISLVLCCVILAFGGYQTVQKTDVDTMIGDFKEAMEAPLIVERSEVDNPSEDEKPESPEVPDDAGDTTPDDGDVGTESTPSVPEETTNTEQSFKDMFDTYNPTFAEVNKQVLTNAINGNLNIGGGSTGNGGEDSEGGESSADTTIATDFVSDYVDNLYTEIENIKNQAAAENKTQEEIDAMGEEFAKKESAALDGLMNVVNTTTNSDAPIDEEVITKSVEDILDSSVCLNTVTNTITKDEETKNAIQESTSTMDEETKAKLEEIFNQKAEENPENTDSYKDLADLFGITLK